MSLPQHVDKLLIRQGFRKARRTKTTPSTSIQQVIQSFENLSGKIDLLNAQTHWVNEQIHHLKSEVQSLQEKSMVLKDKISLHR